MKTINKYKQLKAELSKHHLSTEDPDWLLAVLTNIKGYQYDPKKILTEFSNIKSLRQRKKALQNNCETFEKRMSRDRQVLPLLQRIRSMGIGIDKLLPFSLAVNEIAQTYNLPTSGAVYRVIEDIENYNRIGGLKKEICRLATEIYAINEMTSPRNKAITALLKLQALGITDDEIVNVYEFLNRARFESSATIQR